LSMPLADPPSTVHVSPGLPAFGMTSTHFVALMVLPPSLAQGTHFWPSGQSCASWSHSSLVQRNSPPARRHCEPVLAVQSRVLQPVSTVEAVPVVVVGSEVVEFVAGPVVLAESVLEERPELPKLPVVPSLAVEVV